ncbi:RNA 3'-terminal phosphate cyclase [Beggiatoa leptomitoformis]|uniref:RNA 3'-terminal phosphate cyclase n=1 Tax=Beggiatoa leptomitoformis TaxID=288004 RepID=A0A2N9YHW3_9GAMM|nr:RNA 3'-terminal phosphate cyclase [Beggiatoa leptomitoformis]ALG67687.1 RNA 3'-terminal phosphate cyclase [Beggiatoa leptomitoformis]AUI70074.1 RNA 3'-terminal phosphate cyclase [Beggiatoa leptomitoformis]
MLQTRYLSIDGSQGEGGGQVLRSSLALSIYTQQAFHIHHIRAKRKNPGLQAQHLTAVRAAKMVSNAHVEGDVIGSGELWFTPNLAQGGRYRFNIGTAGSTTLVLQTVLYPLLLAEHPSHLVLSGGTHNTAAPPFEYLTTVLFPLLQKMGCQVTATLDNYGFYPKGGGQITVDIQPTRVLQGLTLLQRGELLQQEAQALITGIPAHVAERELAQVKKKLRWADSCLKFMPVASGYGTGNILLLFLHYAQVSELFSGVAQRGLKAEAVAEHAIVALQAYQAADVPVGEHLADQLLLPLAFAGKGQFLTVAPSQHTLTHCEIIQQFLGLKIQIEQVTSSQYLITVG